MCQPTVARGGMRGRAPVRNLLTRLSPEVDHEVDDQVEEDRVQDLIRHVGKHRSESFSRGMVAARSVENPVLKRPVPKSERDSQGILDVFLDNVSLSVQGQDFKGGTESVKQDGKEEGSSTRSETVCIFRYFVSTISPTHLNTRGDERTKIVEY